MAPSGPLAVAASGAVALAAATPLRASDPSLAFLLEPLDAAAPGAALRLRSQATGAYCAVAGGSAMGCAVAGQSGASVFQYAGAGLAVGGTALALAPGGKAVQLAAGIAAGNSTGNSTQQQAQRPMLIIVYPGGPCRGCRFRDLLRPARSTLPAAGRHAALQLPCRRPAVAQPLGGNCAAPAVTQAPG